MPRITGGANIIQIAGGLRDAKPAVVSKQRALDMCRDLHDTLPLFLERIYGAMNELRTSILIPALKQGADIPGTAETAEAAIALNVESNNGLVDSDIMPTYHAQKIVYDADLAKKMDFHTLQSLYADSIQAMRASVRHFQVAWNDIRTLFVTLKSLAPEMEKLSKEQRVEAEAVADGVLKAMDTSEKDVVTALTTPVQFARDEGIKSNLLGHDSTTKVIAFEMEKTKDE